MSLRTVSAIWKDLFSSSSVAVHQSKKNGHQYAASNIYKHATRKQNGDPYAARNIYKYATIKRNGDPYAARNI